MKKTYIILLVLITICMTFSGIALAGNKKIGDTNCDMASTIFGGGTYRPSTKVTVDVTTDANGLSYCATSQHTGAANQSSGLQFATLSSSPAIPSASANTSGQPNACQSDTVANTSIWDASLF